MELVILFTSYYFADKADKVLTAQGVQFKLSPVPKEISESCGMAIRIAPELIDSVKALLKENHISPSHIHWYTKGAEPVLYEEQLSDT